jgi:exopolysaccharide biosynthesis polyprenyl glycosylphosphotransferase
VSVPTVATAQPQTTRRRTRAGRRRWLRPLYVAGLLASDLLATAIAFASAYALLILTNERAAVTQPPLTAYMGSLLALLVVQALTFALAGLYIPRRDHSLLDALGTLAQAVTIANVVALAVGAFWTRSVDQPRSVLVWSWALSILLIWLGRAALYLVLVQLRRRGWDQARVLIVGAGDPGRILQSKILAAPHLGYRVVGFLDDATAPAAPDLPVLGTPADLARTVREQWIDEVLVALPSLSHQQIVEIVGLCAGERVNVKVFPDFFQIMTSEATTSELGGLPLLRVRDVALRGWNRALKRTTDVLASALLLLLTAPLLLLLALLIKLTSPRGPVFYAQERLGLDGRPFQLVKFRSMRVDAEASTGPVMAQPDDGRTTRLGAFMRRLSIDELPQLVNVLLGEMSLVGPRPERPHFVQQFARAIPRYADRHQEKAGMTGWAQVNGLRGQTSIEERTRFDLFYVEHWSLLFDLKILLKTLATVFRDRNAY